MDLKYLIKEAKYYHKLKGFNRAFKKFLFSQTIFRKMVNKPFFIKNYSQIINKKSKNISPIILQIENTNLCNAKCIMCPHHLMKRKEKIMTLNEFKIILNQTMRSYDIKILTVTGFGEPLVDKEIIDKLKYVNKKYPKLKIDIYTNGALLTKKIAEELLQINIWKITFSINGTEKNYKKIVGLDYKNTKKNVLYLLKEKKKRNLKILTNVSAMLLKNNESEIQSFMRFWINYSDSVRVYAPSDWAGALKTKNLVQIDSFKKKRWPCKVLWSNITIDVYGNVIMCCRDYESKVKFGNVFQKVIKEIRNSKMFKDLQKKQLNFDFNSPICDKCDNSFDSSLDWIC
jgi:radical SAM protein with 4Fe4S-binding SPASM domain